METHSLLTTFLCQQLEQKEEAVVSLRRSDQSLPSIAIPAFCLMFSDSQPGGYFLCSNALCSIPNLSGCIVTAVRRRLPGDGCPAPAQRTALQRPPHAGPAVEQEGPSLSGAHRR